MCESTENDEKLDETMEKYVQGEIKTEDELTFVKIEKHDIKQERPEEEEKVEGCADMNLSDNEEEVSYSDDENEVFYSENELLDTPYTSIKYEPDPLSIIASIDTEGTSSNTSSIKRCLKCLNPVKNHPRPTGKDCQLPQLSAEILELQSVQLYQAKERKTHQLDKDEESGHSFIHTSTDESSSSTSIVRVETLIEPSQNKIIKRCMKCLNPVKNHPKPFGKDCHLPRVCTKCLNPRKNHPMPIGKDCQLAPLSNLAVTPALDIPVSLGQLSPSASTSSSTSDDKRCLKCLNPVKSHPKPTGKNCNMAPFLGSLESPLSDNPLSGDHSSQSAIAAENSSNAKICKKCGRKLKGHQIPFGGKCQLTPLANAAELIAEKKEQRLEKLRTRTAATRAVETENERKKRLDQDRQRMATKRAEEKKEERE